MTKYFFIFLLAAASVYCSVTWLRNARLVGHTTYFSKLMQDTIYEIEDRGWSNLKLLTISQTLNEQMYSWLVAGTVNYTNGFVVSIQMIDVTNMAGHIDNRNVDGVQVPFGSVTGVLNLRDIKIGFDVHTNLTSYDGEVRYFTGVFTHLLIQLTCTVTSNLLTGEMTTASSVRSLSGGLDRMDYMPASNLTEVLSRRYLPSGIWDSIGVWGREIIAPIMLEKAQKIQFPNVCFNQCEDHA